MKHGGATERAGVFLAQIDSVATARTQVADWLRRGESIPGFGHPIYPDDDPRATTLLDQIAENYGNVPALDFLDTIADLIDRRPNIDGALAAAALTLGLSPAQATTIFALGRTAGWIAHAIEQYDGRMIRPRARYVGPQPLDE
jgi:citrate synthase